MKKSEKDAIVIARRIREFLNDYETSRKSEHTIRSHEMALSLFISFLETKGVREETLDYGCFGSDMIVEWMRWMRKERGCSPETCNNRLAGIRKFLGYLGHREVGALHLSHEASHIERMKTTKKKTSGMSRDAVAALIAASDTSTQAGRRDQTLIVTAYGTAARLDELLSLKVEQLHLAGRTPYVVFVGKGQKIRTLNLGPKAVEYLKCYLRDFHGDNPNPGAYVFYSRNRGQQEKMSQTAMSSRLKLLAAAAHEKCPEVPLCVHAHQLRHARASHWLEEGVNIVQISLLLGHSNLSTTMIYLDVTMDQKLAALETIEDDAANDLPKKWKKNESSLAGFCGIREISHTTKIKSKHP
jgi:site-specific recombinase XerD